MQAMRWISMREIVSAVTQILLGIILFVLVIGVWVCLWVPPSLSF
jgi:type II secretory pathway component PulM